MRTTSEILAAIEAATGNGETATGHDLFLASEITHAEHLHRDYSYESAVRYLMVLCPHDAEWLSDQTMVEGAHDQPSQ